GREGQARLDRASVAVVGIGALGTVSADLLARAGIGRLKLIDRDFLEMNNLQRQVLFDEKDLADNLPKAVAAQRKLERVNSEIRISSETADVNAGTIHELLDGTDLIVDGTDNFETRFLLNDYALENKIPWIYGGAVQTEGMSYVVLPGHGPCLRCLFGSAPNPEDAQTCDRVGILAPVAHLIASFQAVEAIKILAGRKEDVERKLWKVDLWSRQFKAISVDHLKKSPCDGCRKKDYIYLDRKAGARAVSLCGRDSVQIVPHEKKGPDLRLLAAHLAGKGELKVNDYLLRCVFDGYEMTVFADGRAVIKGTEDIRKAKSLYAKYIGC
ncbi:MAG: ThiF family adenylyltransferase, partial [Candidatus Omnitrophota bacterium]